MGKVVKVAKPGKLNEIVLTKHNTPSLRQQVGKFACDFLNLISMNTAF